MNNYSAENDVLFAHSKYHNPSLKLIDKRALVNEAIQGFILNKNYLSKIQKVYEREIELGFCKTPSRPSSLLMAKSMVPWLPDGSEEGDFLSIDLGSTNFRVMLSQFTPNQEPKTRVQHYKVPDNVRTGDSSGIFNFMANSIADFVNRHEDIKDEELPLGFTFSFPMNQHALNSATLLNWTINFDCPDAIGQDAVKLLQDAIDRIPDLKVKVTAILNDVTATLASGHAVDNNCVIGFALGSGLNISYVEQTSKILNWTENRPFGYENCVEMDINTEFCALGDSGSLDLIKTKFDFELDCESLFPGKNTFEKFISGSYVGDLVRRVLLDLTKKRVIFHGKVSPQLNTYNFLTTVNTSIIESESEEDYEKTISIIEHLGYNRESVCIDDVNIVKYVCGIITTRGAALSALALATLINRIDRKKIVIAAAGSTIQYHPRLANLLIDFTRELSAGNKEIELKMIDNGASKGGALIAAVADKFLKQTQHKLDLINNSKDDKDKLRCNLLNLSNACPIQANC